MFFLGGWVSEPKAPPPPPINKVWACLCVACGIVWSCLALQFALPDLKMALANTPSVHPLFVLYCIVRYKSVWVDPLSLDI